MTTTTDQTRYIAFLRAINVGGHTVKMERLRELFAELDLANVATFIASGNVIFDGPRDAERDLTDTIEAHLRQSLGYAVDTFLRTTQELAKIAEYEPFPAGAGDKPGDSMYVAFLKQAPDKAARERIAALQSDLDAFHVNGRELYWLVHGKLTDSAVTGPQLTKAVGASNTSRNVTTIRRLAAKYPP